MDKRASSRSNSTAIDIGDYAEAIFSQAFLRLQQKNPRLTEQLETLFAPKNFGAKFFDARTWKNCRSAGLGWEWESMLQARLAAAQGDFVKAGQRCANALGSVNQYFEDGLNDQKRQQSLDVLYVVAVLNETVNGTNDNRRVPALTQARKKKASTPLDIYRTVEPDDSLLSFISNEPSQLDLLVYLYRQLSKYPIAPQSHPLKLWKPCSVSYDQGHSYQDTVKLAPHSSMPTRLHYILEPGFPASIQSTHPNVLIESEGKSIPTYLEALLINAIFFVQDIIEAEQCGLTPIQTITSPAFRDRLTSSAEQIAQSGAAFAALYSEYPTLPLKRLVNLDEEVASWNSKPWSTLN